MIKTVVTAVAAGVALAVVVAGLPPRCASGASAAEPSATELEPITVTAPYLYPADRQIVRLRRHLPDPAEGLARTPELIEQLSDFFAARADPNALPVREIEWLVGH